MSSRQGLAALLLTALAFSVLAIAPAGAGAVVNKAVNGYFGATGAAAGQLSTPRGVAVNQTSGRVYAVDATNNRIVVFDSNGTFLRAFGQDVIEAGPGSNGTGYEICVPANGDFCKAGAPNAPLVSTGGAMSQPNGIAINQSNGDVYLTEQSNIRVQQFDSNGTFLRAFGQDVVASGPGNSPAASAVQSLTVTATGGKYTLSFGGKTTPELAFNATAAQVQAALLALTSIGAGNVEVTGASFPYTITFKGALANNPEPTITAASGVGPGNELEGGIVSLVSTVTGASGYEICVAANGDICKVGVTASTGGALKSTFNGYPAVAPAGAPNAGNLLVADPANLRVQEFSPTGAFVRAFGFNVVAAGPGNTGAAFEVCIAANGDACKIGVTGAGSGQFVASVNRVAEDVAGNIYTVESGTPNFRVQKFTLPSDVVTPAGVFSEANLKGTAAANGPLDVAIDPGTQNVLVTKAFAAGSTPSCPGTGVASVAERRVVEVSSAGVLEATHMACAGINVANGLAIRTSSSTGDVYVSSTTGESRIYVLNTPLADPTVGFSGIAGIGAHEATISGFVNPNGPASLNYGLLTGYHVDYKRSVDSTFSSYPAVDVPVGRGVSNVVVNQQLRGLEPATSYDVRLVATKSFGNTIVRTSTFSFTTNAAPAEVSIPTATTAATATGATAVLSGRVTPNSQATTYRFQYGADTSYGASIPVPEGSVGSGVVSVPVNQILTGLQPATTYHFRLVAKNATGSSASADQSFTTPPLGAALPDNRAFELVSPADKKPQGAVTAQIFNGFVKSQVAEDGQSVLFPLLGGLEKTDGGGDTSHLATRTGSGWQSTKVSPPSLVPAPVNGLLGHATPGWVVYNSPDLSCGVVNTFNPLTEDTPVADVELGIYNLYRRNPSGTHTLITNVVPSNPGISPVDASGFSPHIVAGASDDCSRIFFKSAYQYLPNASGLYEWDSGTLRDAGRLPSGAAPVGDAALGGERGGAGADGSRINSVSRDGSRFFFTAASDEPGTIGKQAVFVRKGDGTTVEASRKQGGPNNNLGARYEIASPDGSHVFFTGTYGLTSNSSKGTAEDCSTVAFATVKACDLYDYVVATGELRNLSADTNALDSNGAAVHGVVAVSDDGSSVYFAARGQLVPGRGKTYSENIAGAGSANIYLSRDGDLSYVATIAASDLNDSFSNVLVRGATGWSAQTTPDGDHLVFASSANVTGYVSGGSSQAYLYSADKDSTQCVSCRLDGLPSSGFNPGLLGLGPLISSFPSSPAKQSQPRKISDDGSRVFFTMPDALTPGAVSGINNIYEWSNGQIYLLTSGIPAPFLKVDFESTELYGISNSGDDVFLHTFQQLSDHDTDFVEDIYDARVGGGFSPPPPVEPPCQVDESAALLPQQTYCQGVAVAPPAALSPGTPGFAGTGNPPQRQPCGKGKVRRHGKCVPRKKHQKKAQRRAHAHKRAANANHGGAK